jgi:hypothetical protein
MKLTGRVEELVAIELLMSMWLRKRGNEKVFKGRMVRRISKRYFTLFQFFIYLLIGHEVRRRVDGEWPNCNLLPALCKSSKKHPTNTHSP